jgi:hypothetical protein
MFQVALELLVKRDLMLEVSIVEHVLSDEDADVVGGLLEHGAKGVVVGEHFVIPLK